MSNAVDMVMPINSSYYLLLITDIRTYFLKSLLLTKNLLYNEKLLFVSDATDLADE